MSTYLLTGANCGIGRGLADIILSRPNNTLIALVRDPDDPISQFLTKSEASAAGTRVVMFKYEASDFAAANAITDSLQKDHGITHLDVVIANAGFMDWHGPAITVVPETSHNCMDVNTIAPTILFSATLPLLKQSKREPKFFAISSAIGSTSLVPALAHAQVASCGKTRAALKHAFVRLHTEYPDIDVEVLTPGAVRPGLTKSFLTDYCQEQIEEMNRRTPNMVDFNDSVNGLMRCIDTASRATTGGGFRQWNGDVIPWY